MLWLSALSFGRQIGVWWVQSAASFALLHWFYWFRFRRLQRGSHRRDDQKRQKNRCEFSKDCQRKVKLTRENSHTGKWIKIFSQIVRQQVASWIPNFAKKLTFWFCKVNHGTHRKAAIYSRKWQNPKYIGRSVSWLDFLHSSNCLVFSLSLSTLRNSPHRSAWPWTHFCASFTLASYEWWPVELSACYWIDWEDAHQLFIRQLRWPFACMVWPPGACIPSKIMAGFLSHWSSFMYSAALLVCSPFRLSWMPRYSRRNIVDSVQE